LLQLFGEGPFLFQHDNSIMHKSRSIRKWFVEIGVEELDWPATSAQELHLELHEMGFHGQAAAHKPKITM
jgi:hypothetical protein